MFRLASKIIDWVDEGNIPLSSVAFPHSFDEYALIIEDEDGVIGRKFPVNNKQNLVKSLDSFSKYASRLLPLHRRTAAHYIHQECSRYEMPTTDVVNKYNDPEINSRMVSYKEAYVDYQPEMFKKYASSLISNNNETSAPSEYVVDSNFLKQAYYDFKDILLESGLIKTANDPELSVIKSELSDDITNEVLHKIAEYIYNKVSPTLFEKTKYFYKTTYPKHVIEKTASKVDQRILEYIEDNAHKLHGYFDNAFIHKLANDAEVVLSDTPDKVCLKIVEILNGQPKWKGSRKSS